MTDENTSPTETEPKPRRRDSAAAEARRQQILSAARALHRVRRYDKISVEAIARDAGISVGGVYLYFKSKDALFSVLIDEALAGGADAMAVAREYLPPELAERLQGFTASRA